MTEKKEIYRLLHVIKGLWFAPGCKMPRESNNFSRQQEGKQSTEHFLLLVFEHFENLRAKLTLEISKIKILYNTYNRLLFCNCIP